MENITDLDLDGICQELFVLDKIRQSNKPVIC